MLGCAGPLWPAASIVLNKDGQPPCAAQLAGMITAVVGWHVFLEYLVHYTPAELVVPLGGLHDDRHHSHRGLHRQLVLSLDFIYGAPLPWSEFLEYLVHYIPAVVVYMVMISAIIRRPLSLWPVHSQ